MGAPASSPSVNQPERRGADEAVRWQNTFRCKHHLAAIGRTRTWSDPQARPDAMAAVVTAQRQGIESAGV